MDFALDGPHDLPAACAGRRVWVLCFEKGAPACPLAADPPPTFCDVRLGPASFLSFNRPDGLRAFQEAVADD